MPARDTSILALEAIKENLGNDETAVLAVLEEIGPAHDLRILEALNQKEKTKPKSLQRVWHINQVTARRNDLVTFTVVEDLGSYRGKWNNEKKTYHFWRARGDKRWPAGWEKVELKVHKPRSPQQAKERKDRVEQIRSDGEKPILNRLRVSEAASILGSQKPKKHQPQEQLLFR